MPVYLDITMHKREIERLAGSVQEKGYTLVPLSMYFKRGRAKVEVGICRGKHHTDKRATVQEREAKIEMERAVKASRGR